MNYLETISISVITSATTVVIMTYFLKQLIKRWIQYEFDKKQKIFDSNEDLHKSVQEDILKKNLAIYPEITEVIYRLRNLARDASATEDVFGWNKPQFAEYCYHLTQSLYKYRLFLDEETFKYLHNFKRYSQDIIVLSDITSRPENIEQPLKVDPTTGARLSNISSQLDQLYEHIVHKLKEPLKIEY